MKLNKMSSCKLCEMSLDQKLCPHAATPFIIGGQVSPFPLGLGLPSSPFIRDMMLTAYLLRGSGFYQPAGPLITVPHGHPQPPLTKPGPLSDTTPLSPLHQPPPAPSSNNGDSSDSEVIITSITKPPPPPPLEPIAPPPQPYRYVPPPQYPTYSYGYPASPYYPTPPPPPPAPQNYAHHDLCYSTQYMHKYSPSPAPPPFRRYLSAPGPYYHQGPVVQEVGQIVTSSPGGSSTPTIMETYQPQTLVEAYPAHYYPSYGHPPPLPSTCFTHNPASRSMPYINAATYQSCPCPVQSCPKNVHTGPLTGDGGKRSSTHASSIGKDSMPLPPVALALPLEPASATGPPSPARGSAGMPPPPSPAGAAYPQPKEECPMKRKARLGKAMVRNHFAQAQQQQQQQQQQNNTTTTTMLLMCNPSVKREIESPKEDEKKANEANMLKKEELAVEAVKEELEPCIKTVAENVKVKNMKRKSISKEEEEAACKKTKIEAAASLASPTGSYKDLIRKDPKMVRINNGRRKLISKNRCKRATKRKLKEQPEIAAAKRLKQTKPLAASNQQNKQLIADKERSSEPVLSENKAPRKCAKKSVNLKKRKLAPAILDTLITKNNIDRTIETVISEGSGRTKVIHNNNNCRKGPVLLNAKKSTNLKNNPATITLSNNKIEVRKCTSVPNRRKSKCKDVAAVAPPQPIGKAPRKSLQLPRWSNGWTWEGDPFEAKVFLNSDETTVVRRCYPAMRHEEGDIIEVRDCVLLKAGPRKNDLPFVAKIAYLWENPDDGEMMMSLLWYYRPEHTDQGRLPADQPDEVFASRHKDSNSVACIDDKCYVLTFHEYCRYRKELRRMEEGVESTLPCIPLPEPYPRSNRQPPPSLSISSDMVFFCRRVYDFRQKRIVKNPS